jgi:hypothetical protein
MLSDRKKDLDARTKRYFGGEKIKLSQEEEE